MLQSLAELGAATVNPAAYGAELYPEGLGYLLVGQPLDVTEDYGRSVLRSQRLESRVNVAVQVPVVECLCGRRLTTAKPRLGFVG